MPTLGFLTSVKVRGLQWLCECWPYLMGCTAFYVGVGYAFGPEQWYQTPSLELVRRFIVPVPVWGAIMMFSGVLILSRKWAPIGHFIAMILWVFWFCCIATVALFSLISTLTAALGWGHLTGLPQIDGWGAPAYVLVYASVHAYMLHAPSPGG